jgi:hypothetical protein
MTFKCHYGIVFCIEVMLEEFIASSPERCQERFEREYDSRKDKRQIA